MKKEIITNLKVRKRDFIDTNTKIFESKKYKLRETKYNWRNELWRELSEEDIKRLGIDF
jgi:hypothetical protein